MLTGVKNEMKQKVKELENEYGIKDKVNLTKDETKSKAEIKLKLK